MPKTSTTTQLTTFPAKIIELNKGFKLVHHYLPNSPVVVADVWVRAGAAAEPEEWSGMAHFLEHMVFKGSKIVKTGEFDHIIESTGGNANAATSHDYAHFYLTTAAKYINETLPYLGEILLQATIPEEEFICEREVVLEELRSSYDDPDYLGFQALCEIIYQSHPYSRSILGKEELLRQYSPNQMRCFHRTHYQPENMTLVLVGGIRLEEALSLVETSFNNFSIRSECPKYLIQSPAPITEIKRKSLNLPRLEVSRLLMGWSCPGVSKIEDGFALEVLSVILAGGRCSRLVRQLREEKHLVLDIHSGFSLQKDSSLFTICAWLDSNNIDLVEAIIREHLYNLQTKLVAPEELQRVKRLLLNDYIFSSETPGQLAGIYGYYQTIATADVATKYAETIKNIQPAELQAVAQKYLSPEKYAIVSMKPC